MADEPADLLAQSLFAFVRAGLREAFFAAEDALGPSVDVELARSVAQSSWESFLDRRILPMLDAGYREAYLALLPDGSPDPGFLLAAIRSRLAASPRRLLRAAQDASEGAAPLGPAAALQAARSAIDAVAQADHPVTRIARTEALAAVNGGTFDAAVDYAAATEATLTKRWRSRDDARTRLSHVDADDQERPLGLPFDVGNAQLAYPGDPHGPVDEVVNCRCVLDIDGVLSTAPTPLTAGGTMTRPVLANASVAAASTTPGSEPVHTGPPDGWRGCLAPLGVMSGDGRAILRNGDAPRSRPLPMEMGWQRENEGGHYGAVTAARIDRVWFENHDDRDCLHGEGAFDLSGDDGAELARRVGEGFAGQVSVDLVDVTAEWRYVLADGTEVGEPTSFEEWIDLMESGAKEVMYATDWELGSTTFVSIPAFAEARVHGVWGYTPQALEVDPATDGEVEAALVAAVRGEHVYAAADFRMPEASEPTAVTITDDGRVFGHLAQWGTCHVGFANQCVAPPQSRTDYAYFHVGAVVTDEGELPVGKVTLGGGHANPKGGVAPTLDHYDRSCTAVAVVRAHDGEHGVWISGHLLPGTRAKDVAALRRSPLSGDWRTVAGNLELVAALAVNVPGFPVPRQVAASVGNEQVSLVAAGVVYANPAAPTPDRSRMEPAEFARAVMAEMKRQERADKEAEQLAKRLGLDPDSRARSLAARVGIDT